MSVFVSSFFLRLGQTCLRWKTMMMFGWFARIWEQTPNRNERFPANERARACWLASQDYIIWERRASSIRFLLQKQIRELPLLAKQTRQQGLGRFFLLLFILFNQIRSRADGINSSRRRRRRVSRPLLECWPPEVRKWIWLMNKSKRSIPLATNSWTIWTPSLFCSVVLWFVCSFVLTTEAWKGECRWVCRPYRNRYR